MYLKLRLDNHFRFPLFYRIDDCHDVLKELHYAAREKDDGHGRAVYYCYCFDLILETGKRIITLLKEIVIFSKWNMLFLFRPQVRKLRWLFTVYHKGVNWSLPHLGFHCQILPKRLLGSVVSRCDVSKSFKKYKNDEGPMLETLDYTIRIGSTTTFLYISICISTLPTQHTTFISQCDQTLAEINPTFFSIVSKKKRICLRS